MLKISALSLVVAASLLAVLTEIIPEKHLACKWPNDILINQRKLAGILIENIATALEHRLVIGVGINMHLSAKQQQHWACLEKFTSIDRNTLIGQFLSVLIENLISFPKNGFQPFCAMINNYDILVGRQINIITPTTIFTGTATGIDDNGELLVVDQHGQQQRFSYGEASPRFVIN
jgi:BirA family biotin operon repressor/biotin-[acetyl-CoA-carboxylase] ligase